MVGDTVGAPGLETLEAKLPAVIQEHKINFVTVNGENAADGFGMTENEYRRIITAGADIITSGNHIWEKRDFWNILNSEKNILRPANYPNTNSPAAGEGVPGTGYTIIEKDGINWLVINLQGRELMSPIDCPFQCFDYIINKHSENLPAVVIVDFHAESTREKEALGYYTDGRASIFAFTHTHVQTADERILPKGSAYITDLGMTGITGSVIGMNPDICLARFRKQVHYQMETAESKEPGLLQGIIVQINADTGTAVSIQRISV
jgi:metallophosphoesterase (TIGR00282 family)